MSERPVRVASTAESPSGSVPDPADPAVQAFRRVPARYWLTAYLLLPFAFSRWLLPHLPAGIADELTLETAGWLVMDVVLVASLLLLLRTKGLELRRLFGRAPAVGDGRAVAALTLFNWVFSMAGVALIFLPASYVWPDFVQWWLIDQPPSLWVIDSELPLGLNAVSFIDLVIAAPLLEEIVFRGLLLHRWGLRWGTRRAVLLSSVVFGALLPDFLGAFVFGLTMSVLYLRSGSLLLPVACHFLNNLLGWALEGYDLLAHGLDYRYTLEEFQADWWTGAAAVLVSVVWVVWYLRRRQASLALPLPAFG
jgi:membrane protease YdiL (CAAX protease family)